VREHQDISQRVNAYLNEKSLHQGKREEALKKIRNLGALPADGDKYHGKDTKHLIAELHQVNGQMKGYSHVNKKALEQYTQLVGSRDELLARKEEVDKDAASIHTLIAHLDNQKDEAILRTFKQVKVEFESIFKQLVHVHQDAPVHAELVMVRSEEALLSKRRALSQDTVDMFVGVQIRVNFGHGGTHQVMDKLSGGQKSLVALALIFAIQRCDPAPFYLFDEIDHALDAQYRAAVALMIKEQSANAQFITSTFKPELVEAADRHYGIVFRNKVSRIARISEAQALDVLRSAADDVKKRRPGDAGDMDEDPAA
jgi:structural maintenance of chromosome 3 (chondroitin sulfate proteoglycan 6)